MITINRAGLSLPFILSTSLLIWSHQFQIILSFSPIRLLNSGNHVNAYCRTRHHECNRSRIKLSVKTSKRDEEIIDVRPSTVSNKEENKTLMFFANALSKSSILHVDEDGHTQNNGQESESESDIDIVESQKKSLTSGIIESDNQNSSDTKTLAYAKEIADYISRPQSELIDAGLVLLSSFTVAVGTLPQATLPEFLVTGIPYFEEFLSYYFYFGFLLRWYAVGNLSPAYFKKPLPLIDFFASVMPLALTKGAFVFGGLSSLPAWLSSNNSALVNLRLFRILRLQELLVDKDTFGKASDALGLDTVNVRPYQLQLARVLISVLTLCSISTGLIYTAEHEVNPMIPDYFTALYFGLTTLTTVGFGDITPITLNGRLVVMGSILVGVAIIPAQAAELVEALLDFQAERRQKSMFKNTLRSRMESGSNGGFEDDMIDPRISCASCGRRSHRSDAFYCWSCGEKLWQ